jgi:hypothetical protein
VILGKFESLVKSFLIRLKVNSSLNQSILNQELGALFLSHVLRDLDSNFA